jgi:hypothetical protein
VASGGIENVASSVSILASASTSPPSHAAT